MADRNSTGKPPAFLLSRPVPAVIRGQLVYVIGDVAFTSFLQAACAWSAAEAHRLDIVDQLDDLIVRRAVTLVEMRHVGDDFEKFSQASKREAQLAANIRRLRREGGAQ